MANLEKARLFRLGGEKEPQVQGDPIPVHVDLLAIQRVFENLVDNAVKYGGCARVTLSQEGGEVLVEPTLGELQWALSRGGVL